MIYRFENQKKIVKYKSCTTVINQRKVITQTLIKIELKFGNEILKEKDYQQINYQQIDAKIIGSK
jgi:hypothetical protein